MNNKVDIILEEIKKLNTIEIKELSEKYCKFFLNIELSDFITSSSVSNTSDSSKHETEETESKNVNLTITKFSSSKLIQVIKFIKNNDSSIKTLLEASNRAKNLPIVFENITKPIAENLKSELLKIDADIQVNIK